MIRHPPYYRKPPINLLKKNYKCHIMLQCNRTKRYKQIRALKHIFRKSLSTAYNKCNSLTLKRYIAKHFRPLLR